MFEQIREILANEIGINVSDIKMESIINEDLGVDSMDLYNLLDALDEGLGVTIPDSSEIETVGDIVTVVSKLKS